MSRSSCSRLEEGQGQSGEVSLPSGQGLGGGLPCGDDELDRRPEAGPMVAGRGQERFACAATSRGLAKSERRGFVTYEVMSSRAAWARIARAPVRGHTSGDLAPCARELRDVRI